MENGYAFSVDNSAICFLAIEQERGCFTSEKRTTLKAKNMLTLDANPFLLELIPFRKWGLCVQEGKQETQKLPSL